MSDTQVIYKAINDIQKLLAGMLASFPSIYLADAEGNSVDLNTMILQPLKLQSQEFCGDISDGRMIFKPFAQGRYGSVGALKLKAGTSFDDILLNHISIGPSNDGKPSYVVYHMPIVVKKSLEPEHYNMVVTKFRGRYMFDMNKFLHEAMIASFSSHLYDMGICPGVLKCFGNYICPVEDASQPNPAPSSFEEGAGDFSPGGNAFEDIRMTMSPQKHHSYLVLQKSGFTLHQLIRDPLFENIFLSMNANDFMGIITQTVHTLFVLKKHFGIIPFDLHLKNVMVSIIKKSVSKEFFNVEYYSGKDLNEVEHFCYEIPEVSDDGVNKQILVQNTGYLVKVVDYCLAIAEFEMSANKSKYGFPINNASLDDVYWLRHAIENDRKYVSVSINFFTYNLVAALYRTSNGLESRNNQGVNIPPRSEQVRRHAARLSEELKPFILDINPAFSFEKVSQYRGNTSASVKNFADAADIMELRDVGEIPPPRGAGGPTDTDRGEGITLKRIWRHLYNLGNSYAQGTTFITHEGEVPSGDRECIVIPYSSDSQRAKEYGLITNLTPMEKFMNTLYKYNSMCLDADTKVKVKWDGASRSEICTGMQTELAIWDPRNRAGKTWTRDIVSNTSNIFDPSTGGIKKGITERLLKNFLRTSITPDLNHYYMEIYPERHSTRTQSNFKVEPYHIFNIKKPGGSSSSKEGGGSEYVKRINIHLVFYGNKNMEVKVESKGNPFTGAATVLDKGRAGIVLGGGIYVTKENIQPLTPDVTDKDLFKPVGFFYTEDDLTQTGSGVAIPSGYRADWAVVAVINNQFTFFRYEDFESMHETVRRPYNVYIQREGGKKIWEGSETVIKVKKGRPVLKRTGLKIPYQAAISLGPILIWEGKNIFSTRKMLKAAFNVDLIKDFPLTTKEEERGLHNENEYADATEGEPYTLSNASDNSMYFTDPEKGVDSKSAGPYGVRESNKVAAYTALCQTYDGQLLFFTVEGGISGSGLDRSQFSQLISHFNVRYAVSLNSGENSNAVYRMAGHPIKWLGPNIFTGNTGTLIAIRQIPKDMGVASEE